MRGQKKLNMNEFNGFESQSLIIMTAKIHFIVRMKFHYTIKLG